MIKTKPVNIQKEKKKKVKSSVFSLEKIIGR